MCGIAGIINFSHKELDKNLICHMSNAMSHRGPNSDGYFYDENISLGHRRLSIIDLTASANQPFFDYSGRYVIIFNGEIYNFKDIKQKISEYPFKTNSDTEVILAAFMKWGPSCVSEFKGMFAFCIWDMQSKKAFLFRDRMGVKPLYYYQDNDYFIFASEIRSILASGLVERKLEIDALHGYFSFQSFGFPTSPIKGIFQLEAGSYLSLSSNSIIEKTNYWTLAKIKPDADFQDSENVKKHIRLLLRNAVERRLVSDVPVGAFLSGGIDSSTVVGLMAEVSNAHPSTFNISFSEKEYDESEYALMVAKKFNTDHTVINLKPETFLDEMGNALDAMDTPSADGINTYVVSKAIRRAGVTVALSGVGGDELFAGYPFFNQYLSLKHRSDLFKNTFFIRKPIAEIFRLSKSGKNHRIAEILSANTITIDQLYPVFRRLLSPELIKELTTLKNIGKDDLKNQLFAKRPIIEKLPFLSQVSVAEYLGYTQQTLLKDTDQMSMAVSLEVREPFFDHDLIEYLLFVPDNIKKPTFPKSLLVDSVSPMLPDEIVHRKKQGFIFPWQLWMKNELKVFCVERINRLMERNFINGKELKIYWNRFLSSDPSVRWAELWALIVLEYWLEKNKIEHE